MRSIRSRTLVLVLGLLAVSMTLLSLKSYHDAQHEIEELFDAQLAQSARLIAGMVGRDMSQAERAALQQALDDAVSAPYDRTRGHRYESKLAFQVLDDAGLVLLHSASAPPGLLAHLLRQAAPAEATTLPEAPLVLSDLATSLPGYHDVPVDRLGWRVFVLQDLRDGLWVLVGEREDVRGELVGSITLRSLVPDLVGLPLIAVLVWLAIGWGLQPLQRMAALIKAREPESLTPLLLTPLPRELEPVVAALNRLLSQLDTLLEREKRFLADAAHELRTPLAVLRIHAQNALE
ncbi:MAG TPA: sensor histidine kinase N-terminal domain-containing protein, partial [Rhodocyclaceae bacterium]|nr:sensor histidine kinase N-terminal domain-containing protein [Rhodocyclaceae bacterium]